MLKKILLNLLLLLVIILSCDLYFYFKTYNGTDLKTYFNNVILTMSVDEYFKKLYNKEEVPEAFSPSFRPDENTMSKLKPILYMGCSFTYGDGLEENETVSHKTAKLTNRPVYNRAGKGWGLDQLVYQLKKQDLIKTIPEPEYLIYIFIHDHFARIDKFKIIPNCKEFQPHFKVNKDKTLSEIKPQFYNHSVSLEHFLYNKYYRFGKTDNEKQEVIKNYFYEALKEMKKYWKNTKFVILLYPIGNDNQIFDLPCWKELEKDFIIVNINKITNTEIEKYKCADEWHPSAEAWDIILPRLFEHLNINYN